MDFSRGAGYSENGPAENAFRGYLKRKEKKKKREERKRKGSRRVTRKNSLIGRQQALGGDLRVEQHGGGEGCLGEMEQAKNVRRVKKHELGNVRNVCEV